MAVSDNIPDDVRAALEALESMVEAQGEELRQGLSDVVQKAEDSEEERELMRDELEEISDAREMEELDAAVIEPLPVPSGDEIRRITGAEGVEVSQAANTIAIIARRLEDMIAAQPSEIKWGVAVAPANRTETGSDAPAHIIPNLDFPTIDTHVYVNPSRSAGGVRSISPNIGRL